TPGGTTTFNDQGGVAPALSATASTTAGALAAGTYYYVVTALDATGDETAGAEASATLTAAGQVTLNWTTSNLAGLDHYNIYRGTVAGGEKLLAHVANDVTTLTDGGGVVPM